MCILCVASRWSRRVVAMLPWLIFPLIPIWALSQFLPSGFRFEITSPRVACVAVLLASLLWYEVLMPKFYSWRDRQRALLRERKQIEAQETAKWRKEATRRCRNCFTAYKDQTPPGGRFMCTFCGHLSKRPVLDTPMGAPSAGSSFSLAGAATGFITVGGLFSSRSSKMWNRRGSQEKPTGGGHSWNGDRPWINGGSLGLNGSWSAGAWPGSPPYIGSEGSGWAGLWNFARGEGFGQERCSAGELDFGIFWLVLRFFLQLLFFVGSIWRKLCRVGYSGDDSMGGGRRSRHSSGEHTGALPETRGEKARRKAEEKRIARLEKEQLEVEERKQREEVARLVEERRRQRDEKLEAEKESEKEATAEKERDSKHEKEAEKRRLEKSREKLQSKEKAKEQETEEQKKKKRKDIEKKADAYKSFEPDKFAKGMKLDTLFKGNEVGPKMPSSSRFRSSKDVGSSARTGFFSKSKSVAASINSATSFWGRSLSADSKHLGQSSKVVISAASSLPSTSDPIAASNEKPGKVSGSAWNRVYWANVWGKAGSKVPTEISKKSDAGENTGRILESSGTESVKCLVDGAIVSPPVVGVFRQPIAPPSSLLDSRDNLFSGPIGFPPVQLPVDSAFQERRQVQAGNMIHYAPHSTSSYFGSSPASRAGAPFLTSCACSDDVHVTPDSLPTSISSSLNTANFTGAKFDHLGTSQLSSSVSGFGTISSPLSSLSVSSSITTGIESLELKNAKQHSLFQNLEPLKIPQDSVLFQPVPASRDSPTKGLWHSWSAPLESWKDFAQPSLRDALCQQGIDPMHPSHETLLQPNIEQQSHLPSSIFFMEDEDGCRGRPCGESSRSLPELGSSFWMGLPNLDSTTPVLEGAAMSRGVPPEFKDCITHPIMHDPVISADGHSFGRSAIEAWSKFEPHEMLVDPFQSMSADGFACSGRETTARPTPRDFYPSPGVESCWSYNNNVG